MAVGSAFNVARFNVAVLNGAVGLSGKPVLFPSPRRPVTQRIPVRRGLSCRGTWVGPAPGVAFLGTSNAIKLVGGFNAAPFNAITFNTNNTVTPPTWRSTGNGSPFNRIAPDGTSRFKLAPQIVALTGVQRPVTRRIPFRRGKSSIGVYALNGPPAGNLLVTAPWLLTSNYFTGIHNLDQFSAQLWFRFNGAIPQTGISIFGSTQGVIGLSVTYAGKITANLAGFSGSAVVSPGVTYHAVMTWDSGLGSNTNGTALQCFYLNGSLIGSGNVASELQTSYSTLGLYLGSGSAFTSGGTLSMSDAAVWVNHALTQGEVGELLSRSVTPMSVSVPASYYFSLGANRYGGSASVGDAGLSCYGSVPNPFTWTKSGTGTAIYAPEIVSYTPPSKVADAYISKSGQQLFILLAQTAAGGTIVNNIGTFQQSVLSVQVTSQGSGYTNPTAAITASPSGANAALGKPMVVGGKIIGIPVLVNGAGYYSLSPPTILISDATGSGAVASATLGAALNPVQAVNTVPTILRNGATVTPALLLAANLANGGVGLTSAGMSVNISGGGGSGAAATATLVNVNGILSVVKFTLTASGSGYTSAPTVSCTSTGAITAAYGVATVAGGAVTSIVGAGGANYTSPTISIAGGGGSGAVAAALFPSCSLTGITVTAGGTGYTSATKAYLEGNTSGNIATATTFVSGGVVTGLYLGNPGSGYTSTPSVLLVGGGGTGATATATISYGAVSGLTITNGGSGYTLPPTVLFTTNNPYSLTCTVSGGAVTAISLGGTASGFTMLPTVWVIGTGSGAAAQPTIPSTYLTGVALVQIGSGYTSAPLAAVSDPTGSGASVLVTPQPVGTPLSVIEPWICIPLPSQASATDVFSFTASTGWATTYGGYAAAGVTNGFVSNYTGLDEPAFHAVATGQVPAGQRPMQLGCNLTSPTEVAYGDYAISGNWIHKCRSPWGGTVTTSEPGNTILTYRNGSCSSTFFITYNTNEADGKGAPIPAAPIATFVGGGGSGALASLTVVNGVVASASVTSGGAGYTAAPSVTIWGPGGQNATATATVHGGAVTDVTITNAGTGYCTGLWTIMWDDTNPSQPSRFTITESNGVCNCALVATTAGTLVNGTLIGVSNTYRVTYKSANPFEWTAALTANLSQPGVSSGTVVTNTTTNPWIFSPYANSTDRTATNCEQQLINYMTSSIGTETACVRTMDSTCGYSGQSNVVDVTDRQLPSYFSWADDSNPLNVSSPRSRSISVIAVRNYNLTTSPYVYTSQNYVGTTASPSGSPLPYRWTPNTLRYVALSGSPYNWFGFEIVTSIPHGFKTGQLISLSLTNSQAPFPILIQNGSAGTVAGSVGSVYLTLVWVTGANTFVVSGYSGSITNITGASGGVNSISGTVSTTNYVASIAVPDYGTVPLEVACGIAGKMAGTDYWLTIPHAATDAVAAAYATVVLEYLPVGRKVYVEYSNEQWNSELWQSPWAAGLMELMSNGSSNNNVAGTLIRAAQVHQIVYNTFAAAGRGHEVKRFINCQDVAGGVGAWLSTAQNPTYYSMMGLSGPIQIDAVGVAPYQVMPSDPIFASAQASFATTVPGSVAYGSAQPWSGQMVADIMKHDQLYRQDFLGSNSNGQLNGIYAQQQASIASYNAATGYACELVGYEGGLQTPFGGAISYKDSSLYLRLTQDYFQMPGWYDIIMAFLGGTQAGGVTLFNYFALVNGFNGAVWSLCEWFGQQPGRGTSNQFWVNTGIGQMQNNVSPGLQAFQDYVGAANVAPTPVVTSVSPYAGATNVSNSTPISATFSVPMSLPTLSVAVTTITGAIVPTALVYNSVSKQVVLTPLSPLVKGGTYTVSVKAGSSVAGTPLSNTVSWSFRTKSPSSSRWFPGLRRLR